jgi:hypothetical protein
MKAWCPICCKWHTDSIVNEVVLCNECIDNYKNSELYKVQKEAMNFK